jgi:superfamily II helicase
MIAAMLKAMQSLTSIRINPIRLCPFSVSRAPFTSVIDQFRITQSIILICTACTRAAWKKAFASGRWMHLALQLKKRPRIGLNFVLEVCRVFTSLEILDESFLMILFFVF